MPRPGTAIRCAGSKILSLSGEKFLFLQIDPGNDPFDIQPEAQTLACWTERKPIIPLKQHFFVATGRCVDRKFLNIF